MKHPVPVTRFDPNIRRLRAEWLKSDIVPGYLWRRSSDNDEGCESRPFNVIDHETGQKGKAKPGEIALSDIARAAHEKIAADLAALDDIDLPVPPVTLYDRGDTAKGDRLNKEGQRADSPRYIAVSAWAFESCSALDYVRFGKMTTEQQRSLIAPFSAMSVFETWISEGNPHWGHILVSNEPDDQLGLAWIDHAFSLSEQWEQNPNRGAVPWYLGGQFPPNEDIQKATADKIAAVNKPQIHEIVGRIKTEWLSTARRDLIIAKLIERKSALRQLCNL